MIPSLSEKSAAQSRVIVTEKSAVRVLREKAHDPESVGKKRGPSRVIVTEKEGAAPSRVIVAEKSAVPSASGKSTVRAE